MSRELLVFLLNELKTVRLICQNKDCGRIAEMTIEQLGLPGTQESKCRFCNFDFDPIGAAGPPLAAFARSVLKIQELSNRFQIEFVLPAKRQDK